MFHTAIIWQHFVTHRAKRLFLQKVCEQQNSLLIWGKIFFRSVKMHRFSIWISWLPCTHAKRSAALLVAKVSSPAHLPLPKSKEKHFLFLALCAAVQHRSLREADSLLSLCSSPFFLFYTRKEVGRNKAAFSQKSPEEVLSLSPKPKSWDFKATLKTRGDKEPLDMVPARHSGLFVYESTCWVTC